jgi:hypothetical protein
MVGIFVAVGFLAWILATEHGAVAIGGDLGSFLYVTFHFILNPLGAVVVATFLAWQACVSRGRLPVRLLTLASIALPLSIVYIAATGSIWLTKFLGLRFR